MTSSNIEKIMSDIVNRAPLYERYVEHTEFFTDTSQTEHYVLNSYFHREQELDSFDQGYTLAVGCSHTFGLGVQTPWPNYIPNCYNAGIPGATVFDMVDVAIEMYRTRPYDKLFLFAPHGERFLIVDDNTVKSLNPYSTPELLNKYKSIDIDTKMLYTNRALKHLRDFCDLNSVQYEIQCFNSIQFLKQQKHILVDKGADQLHYGPKTQENFSRIFIDATQKQN